ncbi:MAG: nucleoside-diphosphate kinase [Candidatus Omnitrophica bacterium]|nr:nucleoside-diphosphate kinase [Candidatus Omnitrophota bacterium]MDD5351603.1 nucleoside-diphosphate kinase [Candidatus Omnitrophota bacterium]MDD5550812.1 nucleoside-diphosphate kinase [Candidatus Omnitrophota bacterium]
MVNSSEATLILIKPDGLVKSLTGNILTRLAETKLEIVAAKMVRVSRELATQHYKHLKNEPFFEDIIKYITGELHNRKKVMALVYWGPGAIKKVRELAGATNPEMADSTSIRGSYGRITTRGLYENVMHCSANPQEAEEEIKLWFAPEEIIVDLYPSKEITESQIKRRGWK